MVVDFYKYQGAGNDFIMLDNFSGKYDNLSIADIVKLCDRRFGIGADGLIKINKNESSDFEVDYYNSDGTKSFCGNGARCSVRFVNENMLKRDNYSFEAIDGVHSSLVNGHSIHLEMGNVTEIKQIDENVYELHTGSPHYIKFSSNIDSQDMYEFGRSIRYSEQYSEGGINVNLVEITSENALSIRTYERGVENETLSCGTGITAAAIAYVKLKNKKGDQTIQVKAKGGNLSVKIYADENNLFRSVELIGPAEFVFKGSTNV